ncbi:hypothetical protein M2271_001608 [Streptomyces sp. LBL]|nr:hypothetical protein [Streptomyces sp. LBL]
MSLNEVIDEIHANDDAVLEVLRERCCRPGVDRSGPRTSWPAARFRPGSGGSSTRRGQHQPRPRHGARATEAMILVVPHVLRRPGFKPFAVSLAR